MNESMDNLLYWTIAIVLFFSAWLQWFYGLGFFASFLSWCLTLLICVVLASFSSKAQSCRIYLLSSWKEFNKIAWSDLLESRSIAISVSLMIGIFSVMLWFIDRIVILILTRWI